jgi:hypothetical protein
LDEKENEVITLSEELSDSSKANERHSEEIKVHKAIPCKGQGSQGASGKS